MKLTPKLAFTLAAFVGAFAYISGTSLTVTSAWLITMASQHPPVLVLSVAVVMVRFFGISRSVSRYAERVLSHEAVFFRLTEIRAKLFNSVAAALFQGKSDIGRMTKSLVDDVERAEEFHLRVSLPYVMAVLSGAFGLVIATWIDAALLMWVMPIFLLFSFVIPRLTRLWVDPEVEAVEIEESAYAESLSKASTAMVEAEVFNYSQNYHHQLASLADQINGREKTVAKKISFVQGMSVLALGLGIAAIATQIDELVPVKIAMAVFLPLVAFEAFTMWLPNLFAAGKNRQSIKVIKSYNLELSITEIGLQSGALKVDQAQPLWAYPFTKPISFTAYPGEVIEIRGKSGAGKSTFASALYGFTGYKGSIKFGNIELSSIEDRSSIISGSLQSSHTFNTTLRENLLIASPQSSDSELRKVLSLVELDHIDLNEILGTYGRHLSGGEEKRLSIARSLLSKTPIVVLDEPLEHLNTELASRIAARIIEQNKEQILIVVTHAPWPKSSQQIVIHRE